MAGFSEGLVAGFSVMETIRDRREQRANDARRISLAEAAEARNQYAFNIGLEDRARGLARESQLKRAASARARVLSDPDNVDDADWSMLQEAGDAETIAAITDYRGRRAFATGSLGDLANRAATAASAGNPAAQSRGGQVAQFTPQETQFLSPSEDSQLAPDQFPTPRQVPVIEVADWLDPNDPVLKSALAQGFNIETPEARQAARVGLGGGFPVEVPDGVMTVSEIDELPLVEREAARARNAELLGGGGRQKFEQTLPPRNWRGARAQPTGQAALRSRYADMLDSGKDSELRQLATTQPTQWVSQYARDRNSLDENTRALVDRQAATVAAQSLANLRLEANNVPMGPDGTPDFSSPQAKTLKQNIERNIAVLSAVEKDFSAADAAQIRGGYMPVGNRQLTGRVTEAWQNQPAPARPASPTEERLFRTDMNRLNNAEGGARRISSATIDRLGKAVARGWIDYKDAESILLTGRVPGAAMQFNTADPKNDVYINGRLMRRGYDAKAEAEVRKDAEERWLGMVNSQFDGLYPDDPEERARRMGQFLTSMGQQREAILDRHGFDPINAGPVQTAALINAFAAQDQADNVWDRSWLGVRRWWYGPMEEQAAPYSNEILQLTRDLLPDQYGVYTLGDRQFNEQRARQMLLSSGDPSDRAAVIGTEGDPEALMRYVEQKIADQQGQ